MELLAEIQSRNMDLFNASKLGTVMEVICEGFDSQKNQFWGRTYADSPDIDGRIYFSAPEQILAGSFVLVDITGSEDGDLVGRLSRKQE